MFNCIRTSARLLHSVVKFQNIGPYEKMIKEKLFAIDCNSFHYSTIGMKYASMTAHDYDVLFREKKVRYMPSGIKTTCIGLTKDEEDNIKKHNNNLFNEISCGKIIIKTLPYDEFEKLCIGREKSITNINSLVITTIKNSTILGNPQ